MPPVCPSTPLIQSTNVDFVKEPLPGVLPGTVKVMDNGEDVFERRLPHQLAVIAVDENYFDYYHRTSDLFTSRGLVMHLDGGIGVFGSVVTVATRTIVVK